MSDNRTPIIIIGTGPDARQALDIANDLDILVYGFLTLDKDQALEQVNDILVMDTLDGNQAKELLDDDNVFVLVAESDIEKRKNLTAAIRAFKVQQTVLVHPQATVSPYAKLGHGLIVHPGVSIGPNAFVGSYNIIYPGVSIAPDVIIGDNCTINAGAHIGREVEIGNEVFIGMGAIVHPGVHIGEGAMVGPGAVVLQNVPEGKTVFGNPAVVGA
ncbi:MAG: NeuD/PglB/VioB family sugar acetyltransferase [Bacteroidia bacterium]